MRIIAKQKDYYDGIMKMGMDLSLLYVREPKVETIDFEDFFPIHCEPLGCTTHVIGFCGKIYPGVEIRKPSEKHSVDRKYNDLTKSFFPNPNEVFFNFDQVDTFMRANLSKKQINAYENEKYWKWSNRNSIKRWEKFFEHFEGIQSKYNELFVQKRSPIFIISSDHKVITSIYHSKQGFPRDQRQGIVYNPLIHYYNFAKVKPPVQAFQEIQMWLSNQATPEKPIPKLSDEDMAASKGHSDPYSFRKEPTKKK